MDKKINTTWLSVPLQQTILKMIKAKVLLLSTYNGKKKTNHAQKVWL